MIPRLTREAGLSHLADVLPRLGITYARRRNTAPRPGEPPTTSMLSPWLRHRLLTEQEVVLAATATHGDRAAEKFIHEVFWRTYFKGYLEQHPDIWPRYLAGVAAAEARLARVPGLARAHAQALSGSTGIDCFDAWSAALRRANWLHNHERMWFASIWIFSLGLPWELGAAFFAEHLIDGDPASNTLGWRWVAGLHTVGKAYVARAENIARYTEGRFDPRGLLDEAPSPVTEAEPPPRAPLPPAGTWPELPFALLLHPEDGAPESLVPDGARIARLAVLTPPERVAPAVARARDVAADDLAARAEAAFDRPCARLTAPSQVLDWAEGLPIATPYAPTGATASALSGLPVAQVRRFWDSTHWPHCARGFFQLRERIVVA